MAGALYTSSRIRCSLSSAFRLPLLPTWVRSVFGDYELQLNCRVAVFLVFRFITGMCGAAFLSVAGGSISDLFTNETVAT